AGWSARRANCVPGSTHWAIRGARRASYRPQQKRRRGLNCGLPPGDWRKLIAICYTCFVKDLTMNVPDINRAILRMHIATIEAKYPIKIVGLLPRGSVGHVFDDNALDFLAEKRSGLDLRGLAEAEVKLSDLLGRPVGIVLKSGLRGREAEEFPRLVEPV